MIIRIAILVFFFCKATVGYSQEWQWSAMVDSVISTETNDHPRAFLWVPPGCKQVRGVVVGQHNMLEEGILEHAALRNTLAQLDFAEIWVTPNFSMTFDFNKDAGQDFDYMMKKLAACSGYKELAFAPVVPIGHSALASYPWNFASWNPGRTLAVVSIKGDAPLTKLTGSGKPNPDWGNRTIEGVPGLFIMGEYEWWENRIAALFEYVAKHPAAPITILADAGHGHFDFSDQLVEYIALFIKKAAAHRLPKHMPVDKPAALKSIDPANGWLMDRWRKDSAAIAAAAPYKKYTGNRYEASWCFDKEMVEATEKRYARARGKRPQYVGYVQNDALVKPVAAHAVFNLKFLPLKDGISFRLKSVFTDSSRMTLVNDHALTPVTINSICGPVKKVDDSTFQISFYRMGFNSAKRSNDIWLLAANEGDAEYNSVVQQANLKFPLRNIEGKPQRITFDAIPSQKQGIKSIQLNAFSDAGVPVQFYVREGPAVIEGNQLLFTRVPRKAKYPVAVTVVAWQYGSAGTAPLQSAAPVERTFFIEQ
jgi:hypothetical protein